MKKPFTLEECRKNTSQKVVTKSGRPVDCLRETTTGPYLIGVIRDPDEPEIWGDNGKTTNPDYDLFLVTDDSELTEFEEKVCEVSCLGLNLGMTDEIRSAADQLLSLAQKELMKPDSITEKWFKSELKASYEKGKTEALKDMPRWTPCGCGFTGVRYRVVDDKYLYDQLNQEKVSIPALVDKLHLKEG